MAQHSVYFDWDLLFICCWKAGGRWNL